MSQKRRGSQPRASAVVLPSVSHDTGEEKPADEKEPPVPAVEPVSAEPAPTDEPAPKSPVKARTTQEKIMDRDVEVASDFSLPLRNWKVTRTRILRYGTSESCGACACLLCSDEKPARSHSVFCRKRVYQRWLREVAAELVDRNAASSSEERVSSTDSAHQD